MNHYVSDFQLLLDADDDEYPMPLPFASSPPDRPFPPDDGIMELFWQNGPVVMPTQHNRRPLRKPPPPPKHSGDATASAMEIEIPPSPQVENCHDQHLFIQEDEMASWLHSPVVDDPSLDHNFCADLFCSPNAAVSHIATTQTDVPTSQVTEFRQPSTSVASPRPSIPPTWAPQARMRESVYSSKHDAKVESGTAARESTEVDSCDTPAVVVTSGVSDAVRSMAEPTEGAAYCGSISTSWVVRPSTTTAGGGTETISSTSSLGGSSGSAEPSNRSPAENRKRKGREADDSECHIEVAANKDLDYEYAEAEKQVHRSKSTKRARAAEIHNLSERRRRDRINEKLRALQQLIPHCNKSDKASMLDEAIEYLKSLQSRVQMMSMGCGMVPMMYPGMAQYMPAAMGMGMNRAVVPFPNTVVASATAAAMGPTPVGPRCFSMLPAWRVAAPDLSRMPDNPVHSRIPNLTHSYHHQYLGPHQIQCHFMQNQTMMQHDSSKPSSSRAHEDPENHRSENG